MNYEYFSTEDLQEIRRNTARTERFYCGCYVDAHHQLDEIDAELKRRSGQ